METFIITFTLPLYFALSGLKTDITSITTGDQWAVAALVIVVASFGKIIGAGIAAYFSGVLSHRECAVVAVLMNARGLVELIVLNLGLSSNILNTRTFSVMVVMCLFTTFITSPIVEYIYPPNLRVLLKDGDGNESTSVAAAAAAAGESDGGADEKSEVLVESTGHKSRKSQRCSIISEGDAVADVEADLVNGIHLDSDAFDNDLLSSARSVRLGVVIGKTETMEHVLKVLWHLSPSSPQLHLTVTAMHFSEPTFDDEDELIPFDEAGRLIRVDQEATDFYSIVRSLKERGNHSLEIISLSLAMFCNAIGSALNSYKVKGNPTEYAAEVEILSEVNDCSLLVIPWNSDNQYIRKLFRATVQLSSTPVILAVDSRDSSGAKLLHDRDIAESFGGEARERSSTLFNIFGRILTSETADGETVPVHQQQQQDGRNRTDSSASVEPDHSGRGRSASVQILSHIYKKMSPSSSSGAAGASAEGLEGYHTTIYSNVAMETSRSTRGINVNNDLKSSKVRAIPKPITRAVGVISGKLTDLTVLALLLRISLSVFSEVTLILPNDWTDGKSLPVEVYNAILDFQELTKGKSNVEVHETSRPVTENQCEDVNFLSTTLFICSYVPTTETVSLPSLGASLPELGTIGNYVFGNFAFRHVEIFVVHPARSERRL